MTDSARVIDHLKSWVRDVARELEGLHLYVLGSLIYRDGEQFQIKSSDVDLVLILPDELGDATSRTIWLEKLLTRKINLERDLLSLLVRENASKPICSVVALTKREIGADIHKSGAAAFFSKNQFLNLLTGTTDLGVPGAGQHPIADPLIVAPLQYCQKIRNTYLAVSAIGTGGVAVYAGDDPAPKEAMRYAAMIERLRTEGDTPAGSEFDTKKGLDLLSYHLYTNKDRSAFFGAVHDCLSVRRGARGTENSLTANQQLFIAEMIFDLAAESVGATSATIQPAELKTKSVKGDNTSSASAASPGAGSTPRVESSAQMEMSFDRSAVKNFWQTYDHDNNRNISLYSQNGRWSISIFSIRPIVSATYDVTIHDVDAIAYNGHLERWMPLEDRVQTGFPGPSVAKSVNQFQETHPSFKTTVLLANSSKAVAIPKIGVFSGSLSAEFTLRPATWGSSETGYFVCLGFVFHINTRYLFFTCLLPEMSHNSGAPAYFVGSPLISEVNDRKHFERLAQANLMGLRELEKTERITIHGQIS